MSNWTMAEVDELRHENGGGNKNCRKSWHGGGKSSLPTPGGNVNEFKVRISQYAARML
jgi:hypothetical protein